MVLLNRWGKDMKYRPNGDGTVYVATTYCFALSMLVKGRSIVRSTNFLLRALARNNVIVIVIPDNDNKTIEKLDILAKKRIPYNFIMTESEMKESGFMSKYDVLWYFNHNGLKDIR